MGLDPIRLEVFQNLLSAVCEESGELLRRTAISPNIRERRDYSCALFDADARLVAQAAHIPVHLGSAAESVRVTLRQVSLVPGDVVILNDPYAGGTHLPDVTMVRPIFLKKSGPPTFLVVNRAHHADIGGSVPGSMGIAADLIAEGLVIPPIKFRTAEAYNDDLLTLLSANVRAPNERIVDFQAQDAALLLAEKRLRQLVEEQGRAATLAYCSHLMDYSEKIVKGVLRAIPDGEYRAEDSMEDDGMGNGPFVIRLSLRIRRGLLTFDFTQTDGQAAGGINANRSIVLAACVYTLRCLCPDRLPTNDGLFRRIRVKTTPGTLVEPLAPAPVAGGNVETSQRLVDVCMAAIAQVLPEVVPAGSAGTMSNVSMGNREFAFYETLPGGAGALTGGVGTSAVQTHMTNTRNTPIEEMELQLPLLVRRLTVRRGSGGRGTWRGGDGILKEYQVTAPLTCSVFADRHLAGPTGLRGGGDGKPGRVSIERQGRRRKLPSKGTYQLKPGDILRIETPGGGGVGE